MKKLFAVLIVIYFLVTNVACTKSATSESPDTINDSTNKTVAYIIKKGEHDCQPDSLAFTSNDQDSLPLFLIVHVFMKLLIQATRTT